MTKIVLNIVLCANCKLRSQTVNGVDTLQMTLNRVIQRLYTDLFLNPEFSRMLKSLVENLFIFMINSLKISFYRFFF